MIDELINESVKRIKYSLEVWYPRDNNASTLFVLDDMNEASDELKETIGDSAIIVCSDSIPENDAFDYVFCLGLPEKKCNPSLFIKSLMGCLKESGILLFPMNNRLGIRYFCGDRDPYTDRVFDGVENYVNTVLPCNDDYIGRMYSRYEMEQMMKEAGVQKSKFYSVYSGLEMPLHIIADGYIPKEDLANRVLPAYHYPPTVFLEEERLYGSMAENGLFHAMANAYLIECGKEKSGLLDAWYVTASMERDRDRTYFTIINGDNTVTKRAVFQEGEKGLRELVSNQEMLSEKGLEVVPLSSGTREISMPYIDAPTGQKALQELLLKDRQLFFQTFDLFMEQIDKASEIIATDSMLGPISKVAFLDMVPLNSFYYNGRFVFFDQEFRQNDFPINVVKARALLTFFAFHDELRFIEKELYERYGLWEKKGLYAEKEWEFLKELWSEDELKPYRDRIRRDTPVTIENRKRMNTPGDYSKCNNNDYEGQAPKPYHIGYVAGAFDMFHIGHLNLLRRAKERCDYLVAGIISDERVFELKNRNPVIPCNERMQVVAGCRYVDEVIELPIGGASIRDAYERVHFDCMFSGDDHANDPGWLMEQEYLRSLGSDIVFVSYTKETSSTDIRKKISQRNLELTTEKNYKWIYTYDYAPESRWEPWRDEVYQDFGENVDNRERKPTPAWITKEAENVVSRLKEGVPAYILLADSHFTYNGTWEDTLASMKAVSERTKIKGVIHLGDMTDGLLPLKKTSEIEKGCIEDMESLGADLYLLPGNHDYNYFRGNPEIKYPETPRYFIDNNEQKIRLIFIDSFDPKEEVRYGFTKECISWLDKTLEALPEGYNAIIFSHLTPLVRLQAWTKDIRNRNDLIAVMDKYADRILAFINGHNHCDHIFNDLKNGKFPIISINCAKCEYFTEHKPAGAVVPERRLGDRTQESFDIMQIDPDKKEIYFTRFGAGQDRIIKGGKGSFI